MFGFYLFTILLLILGWAISFPQAALAVLAELKRQLRLRVIQRAGRQAVEELAQSLKDTAKEEGIDSQLADEIIEKKQHAIIQKVGKKYANDVFGEPDPFEQTH